MKKIKIIIAVLIIAIIFVILYSISDEDFLAFLKYQRVGELKSEQFYRVQILTNSDSAYYFKATSNGHRFRTLKPWFEEEYQQISNSDGFVPFNYTEHVIYYDSTKIRFSQDQIILISPGTTKIITKVSTQIDTFNLGIVRKNKELRINKIF
jgi:uncharacterized membrane protein